MTDGQINIGDEHRTNMRSAILATIGCAAAMFIFYFLIGKRINESARVAEQVRQTQLAEHEQLRQNEIAAQQMRSQMNEVQSALSSGQVIEVEGRTHKDRVTEVEQQLQSLQVLTVETRAGIDAAVAAHSQAQADLIRVQATLHNCETALTELKTSLQTWEQNYVVIFDDDRGRKIASDANAVAKLATLVQEPLPSSSEIASWPLELQQLARPIRDAATKGLEFHVSNDHRTALEQFLTRVNDAKKRLVARQQIIDLLLVQTEAATPSDLTLSQAVVGYEQMLLDDLTSQAVEKRREALQKSIDEQSAAIQQAELARIEAETQVKLAEKEAERLGLTVKKQEIDEQVVEAKTKADRERLEAEFRRDEAEIKGLLTPFLFESESQPTFGNADDPQSWIIPTAPLGPTSFSRLQGSGSLDDTQDGMKRLYYYGGWHMNLRKKGGFPQYSATGLNDSGVRARVSRAQKLLEKYGLLMVEKGMLQR